MHQIVCPLGELAALPQIPLPYLGGLLLKGGKGRKGEWREGEWRGREGVLSHRKIKKVGAYADG